MTTLRHIAILVEKDIRIEARGRQTIGLVMMLGVLIVVVLALGLGPEAGAGVAPIQATAILWVAYLFAGAMCFEKTMGVERQDDALAGLLLAPVDRGLIYVGKLIANLALMLGVAITVTPVGVLLFRFDLTQAPLRRRGHALLGRHEFDPPPGRAAGDPDLPDESAAGRGLHAGHEPDL